jgi:hypothetical protein
MADGIGVIRGEGVAVAVALADPVAPAEGPGLAEG